MTLLLFFKPHYEADPMPSYQGPEKRRKRKLRFRAPKLPAVVKRAIQEAQGWDGRELIAQLKAQAISAWEIQQEVMARLREERRRELEEEDIQTLLFMEWL